MNPETLLAASLFAVVSSVTPGPNNAMLMASGVNFGFKRSLRHLLGVNLGFSFMVLCVGLGLHSVLDRFPQFYDVLRYAGSAYMLWIAWKLASAQPGSSTDTPTDVAARPMGFWAAAAFQWVNPKAWVMAVTCMSTYLSPNAGLPQVALLAGLFLVLGGPCSAFWVGFGQAMRSLLQNPRRLRIFNITMALALVASLYPMLMS
ncbi:LysE family translocator [Rhodoferax saidenbachensis]|uniref:Threonine/homoserine/homoserine lactone efflux protein n=1 Tax=Rhodoferax saidenbachensis TaxID=1484693 RepID=A0ABU1ZSN3_9BURK|nr:LysE family translocator [Rhodoferax saidenbachensis]MDR7308569.1 threonine/homoserine/homoserine lactone efflux protein [Rhodoferax saidenbachensis]